ncbi:DUF692 domain-containing protein [Rheinheimera sp.]|uniref:HvfB family MNIO-type RiPP peptide maturase n=1 Tax=Rheinheimera sp. TaxID=1869214 RepID=UPI003AF74070
MFSAQAVGLGLRRDFAEQVLQQPQPAIDFFEVAPENWLPYGGSYQKMFSALAEQYPMICHGLSLSLGSPDPLDLDFLRQLKQFFTEHKIRLYSEHLSYCSLDGHLYDLLPIPFTEEAATYVAERIRQVQDVLEQRIAIENVSYYAAPGQQLSELEFTNAVLELADCDLLLDVNNIYVNSVNHGYNALDFLQGLPSQRIRYGHVAGHYQQHEHLLIDTHGAAVADPVWELLAQAYRIHGVFPTLLERDFNIPSLDELQLELQKIRQIGAGHQRLAHAV